MTGLRDRSGRKRGLGLLTRSLLEALVVWNGREK